MSFGSQLLQYLFTGLTVGSIYAMTALGFTMIYNSTEVINFAQGEFLMLGGLLAIALHGWLGVPLLASFLMAVAIVTCVGILLERLAINTLKKPSVITLIIITVGASILLKGLGMFVFGKDAYPLPSFSGDKPISLFGATILPQTLWILSITFAAVAALNFFFEKTLTGRAMVACSINRVASSLVGIKVGRMILLSFALSAALGALGGIIITPITLMEYDRGTALGLKGFSGAILGGIGSAKGAVAGGFLLGLLESFSTGLISSSYKDSVAFFVLLLVLFLKPTGMFGAATTKRV